MNEKQRKSVKSVKSVAEGWQELQRLTASEGDYAYRGQKNADWGVESGASWRLRSFWKLKEEVTIPKKEFIDYHKDELLGPARMDGHGVEEGRRLSDLELLAKLQHHEAATCLIDFTRNFPVAMWFACESHEEKDGQIFILNTRDSNNFRPLNDEKVLEQDLGDFPEFQIPVEATSSKKTTPPSSPEDRRATLPKEVTIPSSPEDKKDPLLTREGKKATSYQESPSTETSNPSLWHWQPHGLIERILKQDSLFIFGQPKIKDTLLQKIKIKHEYKEKILDELEKLGITERSLFKDLPGFAKSHGRDKSLPRGYGTPKYRSGKGDEAWQKRDV